MGDILLQIIKRNPEIIWRLEIEDDEILPQAQEDASILDQGTVILAEDDMIHQLNFLGGKIWILADGEHSLLDITNILLPLFDIDKDILAQDIKEFIDSLVERNWLIWETSN